MLAVGIIMFVGAMAVYGTGAFFSDTAQATGNVFTAGTLDLKVAMNSGSNSPTGGWLDTQVAPWNFAAMAPGGTPDESSVWLKNTGTVDGMKLGIAAANTETVGGYEKQVRITKLTFDGSNLLKGGAGATIGEYAEPTGCTVTATPGNLVTVVGAATAGSIVCVDSGTYTPGTLAMNVPNVTLVALHDPNGVNAAKITGQIDITANGVTVRGLNLTNPSAGYGISVTNGADGLTISDNILHDIGTTLAAGSVQAISVQNGASGGTGYSINGNRIYNIGNTTLVKGSSTSAKGIYLGDTSNSTIPLNNVMIVNNIIHTVQASGAPYVSGAPGVGVSGTGAYGILTNVKGGVTNLVVKNNSIYDLDGLWSTAVGLEGLTSSALVTYNDIYNLVNHKVENDSNAVKIEGNLGANIKVQYNNLLAANGVAHRTASGVAVNATNNWWGDFDPSDNYATDGPSVNTTNFAGGPISGLIGGTDQNSNGYADMQDLRLTPIVGATPGLNAGEQKQLVMGVQLDGPTTGNNFQGAGLTTKLTFTLNQI